MSKKSACWLPAGYLLMTAAPMLVAQEQYPKPLIHTPADHPAARVLLLSVDGLHAVDLANWIAAHPHSALGELSAHGVTYTNAHTPMADTAAGLLALTTGGTPISTGIISSNGYDHALSPPGSRCKSSGASIALDASFRSDGSFDPLRAPLDPLHGGCSPLWPHNLLHVNTIFEVVRDKIGPTAWAGESAATTDLLRGPSGKGLDDSCGFTAGVGDQARVSAVLRWIDGQDCAGKSAVPVPALFGLSFTAIATAQSNAGMGYVDATGTPSAGLEKSFAFVDISIGSLVQELKTKGLYDSTWIFVASPYGQSPMDARRRRVIPLARVQSIAETVQPGVVAHITGGDAVMIWLTDRARTAAVVKTLGEQANAIGLQEAYSGARLSLTLNPPQKDSRMPDVILQPELGVLWESPNDTSLAAHGGLLDEDTHVALLISGAQLTGRYDPTYVPTTQLGPLLLRALGMEKFDLQALHLEHSPALPGIF
ncbi:MAG: alkaline phosphatase family protein [Acidobacteriota bacterium]|nr:alkaline phosphatase family protein [Acidobacteriota bacterium]